MVQAGKKSFRFAIRTSHFISQIAVQRGYSFEGVPRRSLMQAELCGQINLSQSKLFSRRMFTKLCPTWDKVL
jgi:hypothetical protein